MNKDAWYQYFTECEAVTNRNAELVEEKFKECEAYTEKALKKKYPECGVVFTGHVEAIKAGYFTIWIDTGKVTYRDPTNGGKRTTARLLDSKKGVFLMEGDKIGNVQMGPTYENNMEPGIFARTFTMERPLREVVEVVAAGFPKIMYPELIKICTVR